jgi:hypothetical protein
LVVSYSRMRLNTDSSLVSSEHRFSDIFTSKN